MPTLHTNRLAHVIINFGVKIAIIVMSSHLLHCEMRDMILAFILFQEIYTTQLVCERWPTD